jgi:hypothetical protein
MVRERADILHERRSGGSDIGARGRCLRLPAQGQSAEELVKAVEEVRGGMFYLSQLVTQMIRSPLSNNI